MGDLAADERGEHGIEHVVAAHTRLPVRAPVEPRQEGVELVDQTVPRLAGGVALIAAVRQPPARRAAAGYTSQRRPEPSRATGAPRSRSRASMAAQRSAG